MTSRGRKALKRRPFAVTREEAMLVSSARDPQLVDLVLFGYLQVIVRCEPLHPASAEELALFRARLPH